MEGLSGSGKVMRSTEAGSTAGDHGRQSATPPTNARRTTVAAAITVGCCHAARAVVCSPMIRPAALGASITWYTGIGLSTFLTDCSPRNS